LKEDRKTSTNAFSKFLKILNVGSIFSYFLLVEMKMKTNSIKSERTLRVIYITFAPTTLKYLVFVLHLLCIIYWSYSYFDARL